MDNNYALLEQGNVTVIFCILSAEDDSRSKWQEDYK